MVWNWQGTTRQQPETILSTEQKLPYLKNNRERINGYWKSYYAKTKEQINQRLHNQRQKKKLQPRTRSLRNWKRDPQWRSDHNHIWKPSWTVVEGLCWRDSLKNLDVWFPDRMSLTLFFNPLAVFFSFLLSIMKVYILALQPINSRRVSPTVSSLNFPMTFLLVLEWSRWSWG